MDIQKKFQRVTPELLSEFLYKRGVKVFRCLLCGSEDVATLQTTDDSDSVEFAQAADGKDVYLDYECKVVCMNCGYTHLISALPVHEWLDEKEEGEGKAR